MWSGIILLIKGIWHLLKVGGCHRTSSTYCWAIIVPWIWAKSDLKLYIIAHETMMFYCHAMECSTNCCWIGPVSAPASHSYATTIAGVTKVWLIWEMCHSVVHIGIVWHHCRHWRLYYVVNSSLLKCRYKCKLLTTNWLEMVLVSMGTSKVSWTCCRMQIEVACLFNTSCQRMCQSTCVDISLVAPTLLKLATFPHSNHFCCSWCTVNTSRCVSPAICHINQPAFGNLMPCPS